MDGLTSIASSVTNTSFRQTSLKQDEYDRLNTFLTLTVTSCSNLNLYKLSVWHQTSIQISCEPMFLCMNRAISQSMKLESEDLECYEVISTSLFHEQAIRFAKYFSTQLRSDDWAEFDDHKICEFIHAHTKDGKAFPIPRNGKPMRDISSRISLAEKFEELLIDIDKNDMAIWSIAWRIGRNIILATNPEFCKYIDDDYAVIRSMRCHDEWPMLAVETVDGCFGNMQLTDSKKLLSCLDSNYVIDSLCRVNKLKRNQYLHESFTKGNAYISGASGMMNSFSAMFKLLDIDIDSTEGKDLYRSLQAFIVCTAMHSKFEVEVSYQRARAMYQKLTQRNLI